MTVIHTNPDKYKQQKTSKLNKKKKTSKQTNKTQQHYVEGGYSVHVLLLS